MTQNHTKTYIQSSIAYLQAITSTLKHHLICFHTQNRDFDHISWPEFEYLYNPTKFQTEAKTTRYHYLGKELEYHYIFQFYSIK